MPKAGRIGNACGARRPPAGASRSRKGKCRLCLDRSNYSSRLPFELSRRVLTLDAVAAVIFNSLSYQAQLDAKVEFIRDCLRRIAGIEAPPPIEITPAPNQWHYRARAQWQYDSVRRRLGYFEANSHSVCDVAECAVLVPELQRELESLRERMTQERFA